jgi:hypothetical protein
MVITVLPSDAYFAQDILSMLVMESDSQLGNLVSLVEYTIPTCVQWMSTCPTRVNSVLNGLALISWIEFRSLVGLNGTTESLYENGTVGVQEKHLLVTVSMALGPQLHMVDQLRRHWPQVYTWLRSNLTVMLGKVMAASSLHITKCYFFTILM